MIGLDLKFGLGGQLEHQELGLGLGLFAGQGVPIGLQGRAGVGQGIDDPQIGDLAFVFADKGDLPGVAGPDDHSGGDAVILAVFLVLLVVLLFLVVQLTGIAEMLLPVRGQLDLLDGLVIGLFLGQFVAVRIHHEQVVAAAEDDGLLIRGERSPARPLLGGLVVLE